MSQLLNNNRLLWQSYQITTVFHGTVFSIKLSYMAQLLFKLTYTDTVAGLNCLIRTVIGLPILNCLIWYSYRVKLSYVAQLPIKNCFILHSYCLNYLFCIVTKLNCPICHKYWFNNSVLGHSYRITTVFYGTVIN